MTGLNVANLGASYGAAAVLHDVSLQVSAGELVSIVGSNGAGKTTLMKVLLGLHPAAKGTCRYLDRDITRATTPARVGLGIALVPEGRKVFPRLTVRENLALGAYLVKDAQARKVQLEQVLELFPILRTRLAQTAGTLSGGEQQMLAIGRALMSQPSLLLLDEPSMGVAPLLVDKILETLGTLSKEGLTILLVEQNAERALEISSRAYVLELGRITRQGPAAELKSDPNVREAYLGA